MIDNSNNLKDKKNSDLKFFYNNTLFKDTETKQRAVGIKKLVTFVEKSLNGSVVSLGSSRNSYRKHNLIADRNKLVIYI
jgi:hypothetical protein